MPRWSFTTSTLALMALSAIFVGTLMPVMGQPPYFFPYTYTIHNNLTMPLIVHCNDAVASNDRGVVLVQPGGVYWYGFFLDPFSFQRETYNCEFEQDIRMGFKQDVNVWVANDYHIDTPISHITNPKWRVEKDGFYLLYNYQYIKQFGWTGPDGET